MSKATVPVSPTKGLTTPCCCQLAESGRRAHTGVVRPLSSVVAVCIAVGLFATGAPAASGSTDLAGRWTSDSLRDNRVGYFMVLRPASKAWVGYVGHLRFQSRDGSRAARIPVRARVSGDTVYISTRQGRFDRAGRSLMGRVDNQGGLYLTNCLERLRQVMSWDLASDCTLRASR